MQKGIFAALIGLLGAGCLPCLAAGDEPLDVQLQQRLLPSLARSARILGDPRKGAVIFHRVGLSCMQCHTAGEGPARLGPDLAQLGKEATAEYVVESLLEPSKQIRKGYETATLVLDAGSVVTGIVREDRGDALIVVVPGEIHERLIPKRSIDERHAGPSMMPGGLVNQLADEEEFFDLASYLMELARGGVEAARRLKPDAALLQPPPLAEYESDLDHAGLISDWDFASLKRGKGVYENLCINCHGTRETPGSLPNALQFASGKFGSGSDPLGMYKTLTHGYRMMLPQRQLTPRQKYDVIHYIREAYLRPHNATQYVRVDDAYLAGLPRGTRRGPATVERAPWREMDYGPFLIGTYELVAADSPPRPAISAEENEVAQREGRPAEETFPKDSNLAYKAIAVRVDAGTGGVSQGRRWMAFDHDTMRLAGAWSGDGFIDWQLIQFNGKHAVTPRSVGDLELANPVGPGWAHPVTGSFDDPRARGPNGMRYGPLPREWARYRGLYKHGDRVVISYTVGDAAVLESPGLEALPRESDARSAVWKRTLNVGKSSHDLLLRVGPSSGLAVAVTGIDPTALSTQNESVVLKIPSAATPARIELFMSRGEPEQLREHTLRAARPQDLTTLTRGGPPQWNEPQVAVPVVGKDDGPFAVDELTRPIDNQWHSRLRFTGLDFLPGGKSLVACCWDGDVWQVDGIDQLGEQLVWKRIASGLFQPLGIKLVGDRLCVTCRDQILILRDLNGDGETDFHECFNSDHQVTDHFHEFAMGLQADAAGNLYYAKSARHARRALVPQHGTLLRVSADGTHTDILANGFRAANGVCLNPDGSFFVTDQEGHWMPMNRINHVVGREFFGNMYSYGAPADTSDAAMKRPLCWVDKKFDRSPAELLWAANSAWGPLDGSLLSLSYGYGKVFVVPHERVGGQLQGGMSPLPIPRFGTGIVRGRFHPGNRQLYLCGMSAWATSQAECDGGLYRIRYTGQPMHLPVQLAARTKGMAITFTEAIDPATAIDPMNYLVETWSLERTSNYGSKRFDSRTLDVSAVEVSDDGRTVCLVIPEIKPTWCMQIAYRLKDADGRDFNGVIQNTIHVLP